MPFVLICCLFYLNIILNHMMEKSRKSLINAVKSRDVCSLVFYLLFKYICDASKLIPVQFKEHRRSASCDAATGQQSIT